MPAKKQKVTTHIEDAAHKKLKERAGKNKRTIAAEAALILEKNIAKP